MVARRDLRYLHRVHNIPGNVRTVSALARAYDKGTARTQPVILLWLFLPRYLADPAPVYERSEDLEPLLWSFLVTPQV